MSIRDNKLSDQLIFDYIEGNLDVVQRKKVEAILEKDPSQRIEFDLWNSSRLVAPTIGSFPLNKIIQKPWGAELLNIKGIALAAIAIVLGCLIIYMQENQAENEGIQTKNIVDSLESGMWEHSPFIHPLKDSIPLDKQSQQKNLEIRSADMDQRDHLERMTDSLTSEPTDSLDFFQEITPPLDRQAGLFVTPLNRIQEVSLEVKSIPIPLIPRNKQSQNGKSRSWKLRGKLIWGKKSVSLDHF
ncbi:MAG: hypothetical protein AAF587_02775 [Bacteroidota bacterium]